MVSMLVVIGGRYSCTSGRTGRRVSVTPTNGEAVVIAMLQEKLEQYR